MISKLFLINTPAISNENIENIKKISGIINLKGIMFYFKATPLVISKL